MLALTVLVPLYFTVVTSLKRPEDLGGTGFGLPPDPRWANFSDAWRLTNYPRSALNSAVITVGAVVLTLLTNSMVAYAISRNMDRRLFKSLYFYFIAALFVPFPVLMLPVVKQTAFLGLDNKWGIILLYVVYGLALNVFIYVGYLQSIPQELEEAAITDGASVWTTFWRIIFPLLMPINATIGIITCVWAWNDFMLPLVILSNPERPHAAARAVRVPGPVQPELHGGVRLVPAGAAATRDHLPALPAVGDLRGDARLDQVSCAATASSNDAAVERRVRVGLEDRHGDRRIAAGEGERPPEPAVRPARPSSG